MAHTKASARPLRLSALLLGLSAAGANAATMLEEVVVTAQKRAESLQDTPISLVAFNNRELDKFGIYDISNLESTVPNLQQTPHPNSGATPRIFIRGVGNFDDQITQDPSVAVYIDGAYVARNQGMGVEVADIERIEILRGPQGTLYGRNATGGAINFITVEPELGNWGFKQNLTFGRYSQFRSRTMVNIPLGDKAAARVAYLKSQKEGFVDNIASTGEERFGDKDREAARFDLLWHPADNLSLRYSYDRSDMEDTSFYIHPEPLGSSPDRPSESSAPAEGLDGNDTLADGHQLTVSWDLNPNLTLKSITSYRELENETYQDYINSALISRVDIEQEQFSQELQLLGQTADDRFEYIAGVYYFEEEGSGFINNLIPGFGVRQLSDSDIENSAYAIYAQATYTPQILDNRLHITLGGRYSKDDRDAQVSNSIVLLGSGFVIPDFDGDGDNDFSNFSPSLTLSYDITDAANVYAKVVDGYKTGGFNVRASDQLRFEQGFDEETLRSYEVGLKSQWLDNRLRVNAAAFLADYEDIQINASSNLNDPTASDILNAGEAEINGMELDVTALLTDRLTLNLRYGYLDADYEKIVDVFGTNITDQYLFINAPQHSYVIDLDYDIAEFSFGRLHANVNQTWQDDKFSTVSTAGGKLVIEDYALLNARLTLSEIPVGDSGQLQIAAWGRNLEDKEYPILYAPLFGGYRSYGEPRSYGVDVVYEF